MTPLRALRSPASGLALSLAAMLSACALGPDFSRPKPPQIAGYTGADTLPATAGQRLKPADALPPAWWRAFGSPPLDDMVALAVNGSPSLDSARATLAQALATTVAARGAQYPQLDLKAGLAREQLQGVPGSFGPSASLFSVGPLVSFDPDPFGRIARGVEQQAALAEVQRYQLSVAYLTLTGNVVTEALTIASIRAQIAGVDEIVAVDRRNLELVRIAFEAGRSARLDVLTAESQLASDETLLPPLRQQLSIARHALAVLLGKAPAEWSPPDLDLDAIALPEELPLTLPSSLVRQRPDILAAEAQLHAA
ncbi:MAG TPA: efflux transporter outer membrane subunit, partial [Stellaceae bacterium]|nr:efflux transporter outer membrane subunit [Stellaceae bacterium]